MGDPVSLLLIGQILSLIVTVVTVVFSNWLNRRQTAQLVETEISIRKRTDYLERQLTEFYGPISALLTVQKDLIRTRWDPVTGTPTHRISDAMWHSLRDEVMIPNAQTIADILVKNFDLIDGDTVPESYMAYLLHARMWPLSKQHDFDREKYFESFSFPPKFEEDIEATTSKLKKQYYQMMRML
jgi:hypothetical protein